MSINVVLGLAIVVIPLPAGLTRSVAAAAPRDITLASTSDTGVKSNRNSSSVSLSGDGAKVAFGSYAVNLDPADRDQLGDIYVKDLATRNITLASTSDTGVKSNGGCGSALLSDDGTKVEFGSSATNLDPADTDQLDDVYVKDLITGNITLASTSDTGVKSNGEVYAVSLSADGTKVAFSSTATNLDPADTDPLYDVYVKDLATGELKLASTSDTGVKGNGNSQEVSLSSDGTIVAFASVASNLDPVATERGRKSTSGKGERFNAYVKDLITGKITRASTSDTGIWSNGDTYDVSLSGDGTTVAFSSTATNLDPADTDQLLDGYVKHLSTGDITLASTSDTGVKSNGTSFDVELSRDGSAVAFSSFASNLDAADTDKTRDIYVKDLATGDITLASTSDTGVKSNGRSYYVALSGNGTTVAFGSDATNLDRADTDRLFDMYVKKIGPPLN